MAIDCLIFIDTFPTQYNPALRLTAPTGSRLGWRVADGARGTDLFLPLDDAQAQRSWLGRFGAAWAGRLDEVPLDEVLALTN